MIAGDNSRFIACHKYVNVNMNNNARNRNDGSYLQLHQIMHCTPISRLSQSPFQFFFAVRMYAGKDFSLHLQRAKSTGGFFDRGVIGGVSLF